MSSNAGTQTGADRTATGTVGTDRITVALVPKAVEGLQRLGASTGLSKTDIVNRAITLYEYIDSQLQADNDLLLRDQKTGETQIIRLL
jgi:hypothetical protein